MASFLTNIGTVLSSAIAWLGETVSAFFGTGTGEGTLSALVPYIALGIGVGILGLGVKYIRSFVKIG